MTVLFADLVGFTSLSERLTPSLMVTLLNRHLGLQALAIQKTREWWTNLSAIRRWLSGGRHSP